MTLFILIELLLVFGRDFSKFHLYSFFNLYDALFLLTGIAALGIVIIKKKIWLIWPIIILLLIAVGYLLYSFVGNLGPVNYIARQVALFVYLGLFYIIYLSFINEENHRLNIKFMVLVIALSIPFQITYYFYLNAVWEDFSLIGSFNYYTPMTVMGNIMICVYALVYVEKTWMKYGLYLVGVFIAITLGHASSFLAAFTVGIVYLFFHFNFALKVTTAITFILLMVSFRLFVPSFQDVNTNWRIIYWKHLLKNHFQENYCLLGNGFGVPYADDTLTQTLIREVKQSTFDYQPEERYLSPPHNSFLTMVFHIGFIPMLLLFLPLKKPLQYLIKSHSIERTRIRDFLILSFIALTIWASFNVILELPHSSAFYWLVYFSLIFEFKDNKSV